jgi:hypothetical protein
VSPDLGFLPVPLMAMSVKTVEEVDCSRFEGLVEDGLRAFLSDSVYATTMAARAVSIVSKRSIWALRMELREAESRAQKQCSHDGVYFCTNQGPCGTGQCPFAMGDLAKLNLAALEGRADRPVRSAYPSYSLEEAIPVLAGLRAA